MKTFFRTLLLALAITLSGTAITHAEENLECLATLSTVAEEDARIVGVMDEIFTEAKQRSFVRGELKELAREKGMYRKAVIALYSRKLANRIIATCVTEGGCTDQKVALAILMETDRLFGNLGAGFTELRGHMLMGGLFTAGILISNEVMSGASIMVATLVGQRIGTYLGMFNRQIDNRLTPGFERVVNKLWGKFQPKETIAASKTKEKNAGFIRTFQDTQGAFSGDELGGRGDMLGTSNDLFPKITQLNRYLGKEEVLTAVEQDHAARMLAVILYQMRVFHPNLRIDNPQMLLLIRPAVRPFDILYGKIRGKIWGALYELEIAEMKVQGKLQYDRETINAYYEKLTYRWFEEPQDPLVPRNDLLSN